MRHPDVQRPGGGHPDEGHPDEGTIHAWLDGALDAPESARIEAHVAECAECAAAVAEARGLVAAASRILGALDAVPAGVTTPGRVPVAARAPRRPWYARPALRAAAALLVVAGGTTVVLRSAGSERGAQAAASVDLGEEAAESATPFAMPAPPAPAPAPPVPTLAAARAPDVVAAERARGTASTRALADLATNAAGRARTGAAAATPREEALRVAAGVPLAPPPNVAASQAGDVTGTVASSAPVAPPAAAPPAALRRGVAGLAPPAGAPQRTVTAPVEEARRVGADSLLVRKQLAPPVADSLAADAARAPREASFAVRTPLPSASRARADSTSGADRARRATTQRAAARDASRQVARGAPPAVVAALAGCHEVTLGAWSPAVATRGGAAPSVTLPARVMLDTALAPEPTAYGLALRAAPGTAAGAYRLAYWTPFSAAGARLVWRGGAAEVDARVERAGGGALRGTATWAADERAAAWRAPIELVRVPCPAR